MSDYKVSVIIPVYNSGQYLQTCLESITSQTLHDVQIICVDDGSVDNSPQILRKFAAADPRITVLHQTNGGAGAARNFGLQVAKGEYLSFLDADDFFEPDMLEKSYLHAKKLDLDLVVFRCDFFNSESFHLCDYSINRSLLPEKDVFNVFDVSRDIFKLFIGWPWDKLFRTEFIRDLHLKFQEQRTTNDLLFVFSALLRASRIGVMEDIFAHHRQSHDSLSVTREKSWACFYLALLALRERMTQYNLYARFEQDFKNYCVHFCIWNLETLKEPTHTLLYNKLRNEWFAELDLCRHPKSYFYNASEYESFRRVLTHPADWRWMRLSRGIQCLSDHGFSYTIDLILKKIVKR